MTYLNFPIGIIKTCWSENIKRFMNNIIDFAIYKYWTKNDFPYTVEKYKEFASQNFGIILGTPKKSYDNGQKLYNSYKSNEPFTGIEKGIMFDFYENTKEDFDILCLVATLALRSIIGKNDFAHTNFNLMFARMAGEAKFDINNMLNYPEQIIDYLKKEYRRNKLIEELRLSWGLKYYSARGIRGFYVSFNIDLNELIIKAETKRRSRKINKMKSETKKIREQVLKKLDENDRNTTITRP